MSKELSPLGALNRICEHLDLDDEYFYSKNGEKADYKIVETALKRNKALEIIKKYLFIDFNDKSKAILFKKYKEQECDYTIILCNTQEEYDLLKEVLE